MNSDRSLPDRCPHPRDLAPGTPLLPAVWRDAVEKSRWIDALDALGRRNRLLPWSARADDIQDLAHCRWCDTGTGVLPALCVGDRLLFEEMLRFLLRWPDNRPVPPSMGSMLIQGLVETGGPPAHALFAGKTSGTNPSKQAHALILAATGPYSNLATPDGMDESTWLEMSLDIRLEHEACHYVASRLFPGLAFGLQDELVADFAALMSVAGRFNHHLFLDFMGLDADGGIRARGRFANYVPESSRGSAAIAAAAAALAAAAAMLAQFTRDWPGERWRESRIGMIAALTFLPLETLAGPTALTTQLTDIAPAL